MADIKRRKGRLIRRRIQTPPLVKRSKIDLLTDQKKKPPWIWERKGEMMKVFIVEFDGQFEAACVTREAARSYCKRRIMRALNPPTTLEEFAETLNDYFVKEVDVLSE